MHAPLCTPADASNLVSKSGEPRSAPWWRVGMVWLVLGGPASVVVAGFMTLYIALGVSDEVLSTSAGTRQPATAPAMQARNHAATGGAPVVSPATP